MGGYLFFIRIISNKTTVRYNIIISIASPPNIKLEGIALFILES